MGSAKEHLKEFGDGVNDISKTVLLVAAGDEVTFYFKDSGTDTASAVYYALGREAFHLHIRPDNELTITKINATTLSSPIAIGTAGANFTEGLSLKSVTLRAATDNTTVNVLGY